MSDTVIVNLPFFPGFYESILSGIMDSAEEREAENLAEREESQKYYPESYWPEELRLDHSDLWECVDYSSAYQQMARDYVESFDSWMNENFDTAENSFLFESMTSPRFYNFETDRVFVTAPLAVMESLYRGIDVAKLQETIAARHTSYDGFHSFYSADWGDWEGREIADFDHNELATILSAAIAPKVADSRDFQWTLCESLHECDYEYLDSHLDWEKYDSKCQQERADKLAKIMSEDPDHAARLIAGCERIAALESVALESDEMTDDGRTAWQGKRDAAAYRCPMTPDMFA